MHPFARCLIAAACAFAFAPLAWAQAWLVKVIRLIVTRLNREIGRIIQTADARAVLAAIVNEPVTGSPEEYAALLRRDRERFGAIVREANIRAD